MAPELARGAVLESVLSLTDSRVSISKSGDGEVHEVPSFWLALLPSTPEEKEENDALVFEGAIGHRFVYAATTLLTVAYTFLSSTAIQALNCVPSGSDFVLKSEAGVRCYDSEYWMRFPAIIIVNLVYTVGAPVLVTLVLLRAKARGKLHSPVFESMFGVLTLPFTREAWYWSIIEMLRKLGMVLVVSFGSDGKGQSETTTMQIVAGMVLSLSVGLMRLIVNPYKFVALNRAAGVTSLAELFILFSGVLFHSEKVSELTLQVISFATIVFVAVAMTVVISAAIAEHRRNTKRVHILRALSLTSNQLDALTEKLFLQAMPHTGRALFREWTQWMDDLQDDLIKDVVGMLALTPAKGLNPYEGAAAAFASTTQAASTPRRGRSLRIRTSTRVEWTGERVEVVKFSTNPLVTVDSVLRRRHKAPRSGSVKALGMK